MSEEKCPTCTQRVRVETEIVNGPFEIGPFEYEYRYVPLAEQELDSAMKAMAALNKENERLRKYIETEVNCSTCVKTAAKLFYEKELLIKMLVAAGVHRNLIDAMLETVNGESI